MKESTDGHHHSLDGKPGRPQLADEDPEVTHSGSGDRFTVKFTIEGVCLVELENVLRARLAAVGVEGMGRLGMTMTLYRCRGGS